MFGGTGYPTSYIAQAWAMVRLPRPNRWRRGCCGGFSIWFECGEERGEWFGVAGKACSPFIQRWQPKRRERLIATNSGADSHVAMRDATLRCVAWERTCIVGKAVRPLRRLTGATSLNPECMPRCCTRCWSTTCDMGFRSIRRPRVVPCVAGTGSGAGHRTGPHRTKNGFRASDWEVKRPAHQILLKGALGTRLEMLLYILLKCKTFIAKWKYLKKILTLSCI
jgi:hypothetical protein